MGVGYKVNSIPKITILFTGYNEFPLIMALRIYLQMKILSLVEIQMRKFTNGVSNKF